MSFLTNPISPIIFKNCASAMQFLMKIVSAVI